MSNNNVKKIRSSGTSAERELVKKLWKMGFAVIRGPASGAKIKRGIYPDVVAIKDSKIFVFEVKRRKEPKTVYIEMSQILKTIEFAKRAGGEALLAIKIDSLKSWKVIELTQFLSASMNSGKRIKISRDVIDNAEELFTYISKKLSIGLDKFISQSNA
ncbi:Holliday junction resolvase Hjc [Ignisphaera sp. 4213-co]|uniref:Crossover junction endodeoxyribonuclease Hjc n=1 Tax=Ignisphaera cupida TaxID=3050454 RepID=A0ABD4Z391_9CREN|nr:Holliday junction resolvase Hjc [Ignisphaera sp. 4213-co]MDK6027786.1 Holliday junction resolvase Hjc [Ignisphaera sp. 4213-co]